MGRKSLWYVASSIFLLHASIALGQVVSFKIPEPYSFETDISAIGFNDPSSVTSVYLTPYAKSNQTRVYSHSRDNQFPDYTGVNSWDFNKVSIAAIERDIQNHAFREMEAKRHMEEAEKSFAATEIQYELPVPSTAAQERFEHALAELNQMLEGAVPAEVTRAVSLVEGAYDPTVRYRDIKQQVQNMVYLSMESMRQMGVSEQDNLSKIMGIFHVMADTTTVRIAGEEKDMTFYPLLYDFEDPWGRFDYTKMFVSKLLRYGTGNCTSLPRLFLMIAEEMGAEAYLAFAPNHTYVKFRDHLGEWHNVELTNQMFTTDDHIMEYGWVKAEAIRSGIFMQPLTKKELIAQSVNELAMAYEKVYGNRPFIRECAEIALKHFPNSITAHQIKANYYTSLLRHVVTQYKRRGLTREDIENDEQAMALRASMEASYTTIEDLGFSDVPEELYNAWIRSMDTEANKQQSRSLMREMIHSIDK